ncbi:hypothetical protein ES705_19555 [subsurface metagenome]
MRIVCEGIIPDSVREVMQRVFDNPHVIPRVVTPEPDKCAAENAVIR